MTSKWKWLGEGGASHVLTEWPSGELWKEVGGRKRQCHQFISIRFFSPPPSHVNQEYAHGEDALEEGLCRRCRGNHKGDGKGDWSYRKDWATEIQKLPPVFAGHRNVNGPSFTNPRIEPGGPWCLFVGQPGSLIRYSFLFLDFDFCQKQGLWLMAPHIHVSIVSKLSICILVSKASKLSMFTHISIASRLSIFTHIRSFPNLDSP